MNGAPNAREYGYGAARPSAGAAATARSVAPTGKSLVEGYRKDILSGFEKERPQYNPVSRVAG